MGVLISLFTGMCSVQAAEYGVSYAVDMGSETNDNDRLLVDNEVDLQSIYVAPEIKYWMNSPQLATSVDSRFGFSRFNQDSYNTEDQLLKGQIRYLLERGQFDFNTAFIRSSTRTSDLLDAVQAELSIVRKEDFSVGGGFHYQVNERHGVQLSLALADVSYQSIDFQDYKLSTGDLAWLYAYSERTQLQSILEKTHYKTDHLLPVAYDTHGVRFGSTTLINEQLTFAVSMGATHIDANIETGSTDATGASLPQESRGSDRYTVDASLEYTGQRHEFGFRIARSIDPSGEGVLNEVSQVIMDHLYRLNEYNRITAEVTVRQTETVDQNVNNQRDYGSLRVGYHHLPTQSLTLTAEYRYRILNRALDDESTDSNGLFFRLRFQPQGKTWSR